MSLGRIRYVQRNRQVCLTTPGSLSSPCLIFRGQGVYNSRGVNMSLLAGHFH